MIKDTTDPTMIRIEPRRFAGAILHASTPPLTATGNPTASATRLSQYIAQNGMTCVDGESNTSIGPMVTVSRTINTERVAFVGLNILTSEFRNHTTDSVRDPSRWRRIDRLFAS